MNNINTQLTPEHLRAIQRLQEVDAALGLPPNTLAGAVCKSFVDDLRDRAIDGQVDVQSIAAHAGIACEPYSQNPALLGDSDGEDWKFAADEDSPHTAENIIGKERLARLCDVVLNWIEVPQFDAC